MILIDRNKPELKYIWFGKLRNNKKLHQSYLSWLNDAEITKYLGTSELMSTNKNMSFIDSSFDRFTKKNSYGFFVQDIKENKFIGTCKLDKINFRSKYADTGVMIGDKNYQGRGISKHMHYMMFAFAFIGLKLNRVNGDVNSANSAAVKLTEKTGFIEEGRMREFHLFDGKYHDHIFYGILEREFHIFNKVDLEIIDSIL